MFGGVVQFIPWRPAPVRLGSMAYTETVSEKSTRFRSLAAAVVVAVVALFAFAQQAHAHAGQHSEDRPVGASYLTSDGMPEADATQLCCHLGGSGIACSLSILSAYHREDLGYVARKSLEPFPSNAQMYDSLPHAPPNPPPIPVRF